MKPSDIDDSLYDAINSFRIYNNYFLSLKDMISNLKALSLEYEPDTYKQDFKYQLIEDRWDVNKLSDYRFCKKGQDYTRDMRNKAAHPGIILSRENAIECNRLTKELLIEFIHSKEWIN